MSVFILLCYKLYSSKNLSALKLKYGGEIFE
nr:MAG TPA: hypothetical protein [Caudoviricetes sp.]